MASGIKAGKAFVELGLGNKITKGLKSAQRKLKAFGTSVSMIGKQLAMMGAAGLAAFAGAAKVFASMGDNLAKMAKRTGFTVEALSELSFVAKRSGTDVRTMEVAFRRMQRSIYDAERGLSTAVDGFADLGLTVKHLTGLKPEDQFKLIAEQVSKIEDPTRKAAIAMTLLGRSGTMMLPMMEQGAKGIEELQQQARALGLTISGKDAKAAEDFTDIMGDMWEVAKHGVFVIGASLMPILQDMAKRFVAIAATAREWIDNNRQLFATIFKLTAAVTAGGIALVVFGGAFRMVAGVIGGVVRLLPLLASGFALLLSPMGMAIVAAGAIGAVLLHATGVGAKALGWLADKWNGLKDIAVGAWSGIVAALKSGDLAAAAKIGWLGLTAVWLDATQEIRVAWHNLWGGIKKIMSHAWQFMRKVHSNAVFDMTKLMIEAMALWDRSVAKTKSFFLNSWTGMVQIAKELFWTLTALVTGMEDKVRDKMIENVRLAAAADYAKADREKNDALDKTEAKRSAMRTMLDADHQAELDQIATSGKASREAIDKETARRKKLVADRLKDAKQELADAVAASKTKAKALDLSGGPGGGTDVEGIVDRLKLAVGGLGAELDSAGQKMTARGTFNVRSIQSLQASSEDSRTAKATEATAKSTKEIATNTKDGGLTFAGRRV